jgi:DeoR/GlpR family transcriptional regulator of sugar metabolism
MMINITAWIAWYMDTLIKALQLTARRDIKKLLEQRVIQKVKGRSVSYTLLFDENEISSNI